MFLLVYWSSVKLFIKFLIQSGQFPHAIDPKSPVSTLLTSSTFWKEALFDWDAGGIFADARGLIVHVINSVGDDKNDDAK
jgi:hypothetical protein